MIRVKRFSATGQHLGDVTLDLRKSSVASRIVSALHDGASNVTVHDLTRLDANSLSLDRIRELFTPEEIRVALQRRRVSIDEELAALEQVEATLAKVEGFDVAQGGDRAARRSKR